MTTPRSRLRVIRETAQALQRVLSHLGGSDEDIASQFESEQRLWEENAADIDRDLDTLRSELEAGKVKAEIDDEVEFVRNAWSEAKEGWTRLVADHASVELRSVRLATIDERLAAMVRKIGFLTIPERVADFVGRERAGGVFHFHTAFENELPVLADRVALLDYLAESPGGLYGIVDVKQGLIWAVSRGPWYRSPGYMGSLAILLIGGLIALFSHDIASRLGISTAFADQKNVLATYILVTIGVLGHIAIDLYKQTKVETPDSPTAMEQLGLWGAVHERQMLGTAGSVWIGTAILIAAFNPVDPWTALLAGYSLDSVVDAGIMRFESAATKGTRDLTDKLAATGASA